MERKRISVRSNDARKSRLFDVIVDDIVVLETKIPGHNPIQTPLAYVIDQIKEYLDIRSIKTT